jgi:hypothetical protein
MEEKLMAAGQEVAARRKGASHPAGRTDNGGRWYPSKEEYRPCCDTVRSPSRAWRWSVYKHCHTISHVAALYDVDEKLLRRLVKKLEA